MICLITLVYNLHIELQLPKRCFSVLHVWCILELQYYMYSVIQFSRIESVKFGAKFTKKLHVPNFNSQINEIQWIWLFENAYGNSILYLYLHIIKIFKIASLITFWEFSDGIEVIKILLLCSGGKFKCKLKQNCDNFYCF